MMVSLRFDTWLKGPLPAAGRVLLVACLLFSAWAGASPAQLVVADTSAGEPQEAAPSYLIVENVGQFAPEARFLLRQGDLQVWVTADAVWLTVPDRSGDQQAEATTRQARRDGQRREVRSGTALRFTFPGANAASGLEPFGRVSATVSYLTGSDPSQWQRNVPVWSGVRYRDLYPGVDLVIGGDAAGAVPWRFEARPGAELGVATLQVEGAEALPGGAGELRFELKGHTFELALPVWTLEGQVAPLPSTAVQLDAAAFAVTPGSQLMDGPAASPETINGPADLIYSTFLGGTAADGGAAIALDYLGNAYIVGETQSAAFPGAPGSYNGATDAFAAKFNVGGTALLYATYLGGTGQDLAGGIAVEGNLAYVVGDTTSANFLGKAGTGGDSDIFVVALSADGTGIRYVSRLGGNGLDFGSGIALEGTSAYIVGSSQSTNLAGAPGCASSTNRNLVVARLDAAGGVVYTTCMGGSELEVGNGIAVRGGIAYVTGQSFSSDLPGTSQAGNGDILVARFDGNGTLVASQLIGGASEDTGTGIAADLAGNLYVIGTTGSTDFPVTNASVSYGGGSTDAVVVRLNTGFAKDFAQFLGGEGDDDGSAIAVDTIQALYVAGTTTSEYFPFTANGYDVSYNGGLDAFVARLDLNGTLSNRVTYATYLGAAQDDEAFGIATDTGGHAFVGGHTASALFPTSADAFDRVLNLEDAFVTKLRVTLSYAAPAALTIATSGTDAVLTWGAVSSASGYQVLKSSSPYFKPGDWSSSLLSEPAGTTAKDSGALAQVNAIFYVVKAVVPLPVRAASATSNRVGKFTFQLTPGGN